ncbi:MAG: alpha-L-fucosidase [Ruminococcaceae bacterium]|nr:alpha-L-fucosidase [Oscillospiraceae bacterium]
MAIPVPEKRIAEFENFGFGMFIHWGIYSQMGMGEWVMNIAGIPKDEYKKLADTFTASKYDARKWVKIAKAAGMKYMTLTTRHHDGFSLYDTCGLCDYDAPHYLNGRDLVREFVDACNEEGIVPFFYHTTLDWYQESFDNDFPAYLQYLRDSVEVLCSKYGKIGGMWFDGNWSKPQGTDWEEDKLYEVIRKHQPDAIIVNNTGLSARGEVGNPQLDSVTFEQGRPTPMDREGHSKYVAAEMCHTMNDHWGFGSCDLHYKSLPELIETLCACRKVGANYLLNVGPDGDGEIILMQEALLRSLGTWVETCGQCIYEGKPSKIHAVEKKNFALEKDGKAYLFIHNMCVLGDANVTVEGDGLGPKNFDRVKGEVRSVKWTDNGEELSFTQDGEHLIVNATGFPYGKNFVVRVAEVDFE